MQEAFRAPKGRGSVQIFWVSLFMQVLQIRVEPISFLLTVILIPVFHTFTFLFILQHAGKLTGLAAYGIMGPVLLSIWANAIFYSGELIETERIHGTLEMVIATSKNSAEISLAARAMTNTFLALLALPQALLIARLGFGMTLHITSFFLFVLALLIVILSTCAAATIMANLFVLSRSVRIFQNALTYPFYLLAGLAFPLTALPAWLRPFSIPVALSWGSDLLQQSTGLHPYYSPGLDIGMGVGLTAIYFVIGHLLFCWTERRVRSTATLGSF
jgi:ABC-2 type transport system permease protein